MDDAPSRSIGEDRREVNSATTSSTGQMEEASGRPRPTDGSSSSPAVDLPSEASLETVDTADGSKHLSTPKKAAHHADELGICVHSEEPFKLKIDLAGVPMDRGGIPRAEAKRRRITLPTRATALAPTSAPDTDSFSTGTRTSGRSKLTSYAEKEEDDLEDTDSDISDEDRSRGKNMKRSHRKAAKKRDDGYVDNDSDDDEYLDEVLPSAGDAHAIDPNQVEAPPPGVLSSLWYSRECVLHVFVVDKILGWKTRPVRTLEYTRSVSEPLVPTGTDGTGTSNSTVALESAAREVKRQKEIDPEKSIKWSADAFAGAISDPRARMEVSRINPSRCPEVLKIASSKENRSARRNNNEPDYVARTSKVEREEVVLVKWRGRSYLHCSWERLSDLEELDPTKTTAKSKIKRYLQSQESVFGWNWKAELEKERFTFHEHGHGSHAREIESEDKYAPTEEEEFFPPDYVEVERILACDESEINMDTFQKQRSLNRLTAEQEALLFERNEEGKGEVQTGTSSSAFAASTELDSKNGSEVASHDESDDSWDPEDYVRYVVKFKGLLLSDLTWEYWLHLKNECVDQAEDFWLRQHPPSPDELKDIVGRKHPKFQNFRKLKESPVFSISSRKKKIASLNGQTTSMALPSASAEDEGAVQNALKLRGYQLEGVNWLLWNWWNRRSCILADEMGLGKTIQSVTFLAQLMRMPQTQLRGPFLVVAPLSLVSQWQSEAATWVPDMNLILYHGSADARDFLVQQEFYYTDQFTSKAAAAKLKRQNITKCHIVVTTYEVVMKDIAVLSRIRWKALIVDEAHRLKNSKSRLFMDLGGVPRDFCLLLTGTPLQNSTDELWALLHFADPINFASREAFIGKFGQLTSQQQVSDLHKILKPYLLRRLKEDVERSLPPREETILEVTLTPIQKTYYKAIYEKNTTFLFKGPKSKNAPSLMNAAMELRKCCNHPFLIGGAEERILADAAAAKDAETRAEGSSDSALKSSPAVSAAPVDLKRLTGEQLIKSSGKMVLLDKLLPKLKSGGHKVLIFSQMVRVLDLLEDLLRLRDYKFERLDGSRSASSRAGAVDRFNDKSFDRFVMLLSTRAGGLGLNLVSADTVIIFDSDWNPQNDLQAMARAHRIGQTRAVSVYRLLTSKTYEMHMFNSASMKLGLDRAVLAQQRANEERSKSKRSSKEQATEIDELLKKGAYDVFREEDDKEAQLFMEETDIDKLLERSSTKVTYGTEKSSLSSGLGSFSKASFVASGEGYGKDVDLDDPDFWEKAVGLQAPPDPEFDALAQLMTDGKRNRKQVQQYDPYFDDKVAEQKKQERIAEFEKEEEEERVVGRLAKFLERQDKKDRRKKRKREEAEVARERERLASVPRKKKKKKHFLRNNASEPSSKESKSKESKSKQSRKAERRRALRRAEKEDPVLERVRQAWEVPHRNRVTSAALRFGFGRFSKIRQEANLNSVPLQDIEVFVRAYLFQLGVQGSVSFTADSDPGGRKLKSSVASMYNQYGTRNSDWMFSAMNSSLTILEEVGNSSRYLRIPLVLADPDYLNELRSGAALRALRRFAFLSRVNAIVEKALDGLLRELGSEELGRRGISIKNLSLLDMDLKARHVSTEELLQAVGTYLPSQSSTTMKQYALPSSITPWWDKSCDSALIIGTFIHGCGNYETMRNDDELPFSRRIIGYIASDPSSAKAHLCFQQATKAAKAVYVDALKTAKRRQQIESHEAVAAVIAASKDVAEAGEMSNGSAADKDMPSSIAGAAKPKKKSRIVDESDTITLHRLSRSLIKAIQDKSESLSEGEGFTFGSTTDILSRGKKKLGDHPYRCLPMPDATFLDSYLNSLIDSIDCDEDKPQVGNNEGVRSHANVSHIAGSDLVDADTFSKASAVNVKVASAGLGNADNKASAGSFQGLLCGSRHKSLNDHSSYDHGAASSDLASLATGADSTRYKRGPCVPLYLSRYSICALVYADTSVVDASCEAKRSEIDIDKENQKRTNTPFLIIDDSSSAKSISGATATEEAVSETINFRPMAERKNASEPKRECVYAIPPAILNDVHIRAGLCVALLKSGSPASDHELSQRASHDVYKAAHGGTTASPNQDNVPAFFSTKALAHEAARLAGSNIILPCEGSVQSYIDQALLPHCLRLCMEGEVILSNDTSRRAHNIVRSPIPDPWLPVEMHSEEAIRHASAILRRVRLTRAVRFVAGGGIPFDEVMSTLHGPSLRRSLGCLPLWWCPWIHDLGLLLHVAMYGLVGLTNTHQDGVWDVLSLRRTPCFELDALQKHIRSIFVEGINGNPPNFPAHMLKSSSSEDVDTWIRLQADLLPSGKVLERRLALICSEMTRHIDRPREEIAQAAAEKSTSKETTSSVGSYKYDIIPMFDLGGWPINE